MAQQPKEERIVEIIVNGQRANASLKEMDAAVAVLNNQFRKMAADDPARAGLLTQLTQMKARVAAVRAEVNGVAETTGVMKQAFANAFAIFTGGGILGVVQQVWGFFAESRQQFQDSAKSGADLEATLKSTGHAAGLTAAEIRKIGEERAKVTLFDDDETNRASAMLLTFTNIKKGVFEEAVPAIQDLATKMGGDGPADLKGASVQVGKALNDPVNGIKALTRVGVTFNDQQKEQIKTMVKAGDTAGAQRLILAELNKEFGGSAKAAREAGGGVATLTMWYNEFQETVGGKVSQVLNALSQWLGRVIEKSGPLVDMVSELVDEFASYYRELYDIVQGLGLFNEKTDTAALFVEALKTVLTVLLIPLRVGLGYVRAWVEGFIDLYNRSELLRGILGGLGASIKSLFISVVDDAVKILGGVGDILVGIFTLDKDKIAAGFKASLEVTADLAYRNGLKAADAFAKGYQANKNNHITKSTPTPDAPDAPEKPVSPSASDAGKGGETDKEKKAREKKALDELLERIEFEKRAQLAVLDVQERGIQDRGNLREIEQAGIELDAERKVVNLVAAEKAEEAKLTGTTKQKNAKRVVLQQELDAQIDLVMSEAAQAQRQKQEGYDKQDREDYSKLIEQKLADIEAGEVEMEAALQEAFEDGLIKEKSRNEAIYNVQLMAANNKLALIEATEGMASAAYRKAYKEREKLQKDHHKQELADQKAAHKARFALEQQGMATASDALQFGLELLEKDKEGRKKHHKLYVALAAAKIIVDGAKEVQAIWEYSAEQPENSLTAGIFGTVLAGVQTGLAVARTIGALTQINKTGYAQGGGTGTGAGMAISPMGQLLQLSGMSIGPDGKLNDGSGHAVAGVVHNDEYVVPKWQLQNPQDAAVVQWLEARRVRGFADGGATNTAPVQLPVAAASPRSDGELSYAVQSQMLDVLREVSSRLAGVEQWQRELRVVNSIQAQQQASDEYKQVRHDSAIRSRS